MARKLRGTAIQSGTINITQLSTTVVNNITTGGGPKVTSITYPNSATAAVNTGNQSIVLTGTGFESNVQVYVNGSAVPAVSRANANSLSFTTPALSTGATYPLYVVNPDGGTAVFVPGMIVSAGPVWVTDATLSSWGAGSALSRTLQATSDSTVSYALDVGSSLPAGLSLAANGVLSGTLSSPPASETTYNFTVVATDLESQKSSKAFSITATIGITAATGGTVSNIAGYRVHTFTSSGTFEVVSGAGSVEYLVVAGGGGGGQNGGGGGGAGGLRTGTLSLTTTSYTVTIGGGGGESSNGSNSIFSTITAIGGGGGGSLTASGKNGGSGGGGGSAYPNPATTGAGGLGTAGQGNNGGLGNPGGNAPSNVSGGGGGGAGSAGSNAPGVSGGNGGNGTASTLSGSSVTYAGGGAGGGGGGGGTGGSGGGGNGVPSGGSTGGTNTGGGGGGGGNPAVYASSGGSGIVIIRYAV